MSKINVLKSLVVVFLFSLAFVSCGGDDQGGVDPIINPENEVKSGILTADETWTADRIYELAGKVVVADGITLTVEAGCIVKGRQGQGSLSSALIVAKGGKIMAEGTSDKPIIFTTLLDNIEVGEQTGTNLDETDVSKWGGLILLGKAKISAKVGDTETQIEGIPADEDYGKYGGSDDADNSGVLKYVSIRHGGTLIGEGNEINGLTLGGVGTGTTIDYIEIVANLDDGIECFGGSVNINHALVAYQGDDAFDIDQNYSGAFENSMVVYNDSGDEFLEIDGPENATHTMGKFTINNCSFISKTANGSVDLKSKAQGLIENCYFEGLSEFKLSASFKDDCATPKTDAYDRYVATPSMLEVLNNATDAPLLVYTKSEHDNNDSCAVPASYQTTVDGIFATAGNSSSATGTGANQSDFDGWSWTALNNKF